MSIAQPLSSSHHPRFSCTPPLFSPSHRSNHPSSPPSSSSSSSTSTLPSLSSLTPRSFSASCRPCGKQICATLPRPPFPPSDSRLHSPSPQRSLRFLLLSVVSDTPPIIVVIIVISIIISTASFPPPPPPRPTSIRSTTDVGASRRQHPHHNLTRPSYHREPPPRETPVNATTLTADT